MDKRELNLGVTNSYLLKAGTQYLLIDTGYENSWELFSKRLKEVGVSLSQISYLLLTHHHDDHCGLLNKVVEQNPDIRIIMSYRAKDYLLAGRNNNSHRGGWVNRRVNLLFSFVKIFDQRWKTHPFPPYKAREKDILIKGETCFQEIGIGLNGKIIETPGHCPDSISAVFADGDCFVGDAAANFPSFFGTNNCVIMIEDLDAYYQSWKKLLSEGASQIFPAHGKPFLAAILKQNIDKNSIKQFVTMP